MKKSYSILVLILCGISATMTVLSHFDKFLSTSYLIKIGLALLLPVIAIIIVIRQLVKKNNNRKNAKAESME